jgi:DoxX-like family
VWSDHKLRLAGDLSRIDRRPCWDFSNENSMAFFDTSTGRRSLFALIQTPWRAITLVIPGVVKLKEWAYAGFTFAWIPACVAHYLAKDGPVAFMPLILLLLLVVS